MPTTTTPRRFGLGSALTIGGAVLILASLPMTWYHAERATHTELTGWAIFTNLRIWLVVAAILAILTALLPQGREAVVARCGLGFLAGLPVLRRIIDPPGGGVVHLDQRIGLWVALAGALAIIAGGVLSAGRRMADHYGWDVPGMGMGPSRQLPPPAPAPPASGGTTRFARPGSDEEPIVDAEVISEG
jgi:hypothetical protein